jgi:hypothetical protein
MNTSHTTFRVPPTTVASAEEMWWLTRHTNRNLYADYPDRFYPSSEIRATDPAFTGGTMTRLEDFDDVLQLIAHEERHGHGTVLLDDLNFDLWVVLSLRRFRGRRRG